MGDSQVKLYISGGNHITVPSLREGADGEFDSVDVIFVEAPFADETELSDRIVNIIAMPLLIIPFYIILVGQTIFKAFGLHDSNYIDELYERSGAEIVETDVHIPDVISNYRLPWILVHLITVFLVVFTLPILIQIFDMIPPITSASLGFIGGGVLMFGAFAAGTLPARDMQMAADIENYSREKDIETAVLVTGSLHESGVRRRLKGSQWVELQ